jgi:hypothetical protein
MSISSTQRSPWLMSPAQVLQGQMCRSPWPEAVGAGKKVLLVDGLQHYDDRPLCHLVLQGSKSERPKRSIQLRNIGSTHRRCPIAARLDAAQEVQEMGLKVPRIVGRRHTVDAGSTILAGEPPGLLHPIEVDDMMQRGQRHSTLRSCQRSYPSWRSAPLARRRFVDKFAELKVSSRVSRQRLSSRGASLPRDPSGIRARFSSAPVSAEDRPRPGHLFSRLPKCGGDFDDELGGQRHRLDPDTCSDMENKTMSEKLTVRPFFERFPDDAACLDHVMDVRYGLRHECGK